MCDCCPRLSHHSKEVIIAGVVEKREDPQISLSFTENAKVAPLNWSKTINALIMLSASKGDSLCEQNHNSNHGSA